SASSSGGGEEAGRGEGTAASSASGAEARRGRRSRAEAGTEADSRGEASSLLRACICKRFGGQAGRRQAADADVLEAGVPVLAPDEGQGGAGPIPEGDQGAQRSEGRHGRIHVSDRLREGKGPELHPFQRHVRLLLR